MFKVAIPTYNRLQILKSKCLAFLESINIEQSSIYIFIDPRSYAEYCQDIDLITSDYHLIEGKEGLANQRNAIRNYFLQGEKLLICDDDLISLDSGSLPILEEIIYTFDMMKNEKCLLGGFNPTPNPYFKSNEYKVGHFFCVGCCYCQINSYGKTLYLNEDESEKEDFLNTIKAIRYSGKTLRNDKVNIIHRSLNDEGGMTTEGRANERKNAFDRIMNKYSYLLKTRKKKLGLELQFKNNLKRIYPKYDYQFDLEFGDYPELNPYLYELPRKYNYEAYDGEKLLFRLIRNGFDWNDINMDAIQYYLETMRTLSSNRGNLGGKIAIEKLQRWQRDKIKELGEVKLNKYGTMTHKDSTGYSWGNPIRSATMSDKSAHYRKLKKEGLDEPIKQIAKQLNELYDEYLIKPEEMQTKKSFEDTNFDELIFNYNTQTAIHCDSHNSAPYSIMTTWGDYQDYQFILPDYNLCLDLEAGDILIFDGRKIRHGNMQGTGTRISIVGYQRRQ